MVPKADMRVQCKSPPDVYVSACGDTHQSRGGTKARSRVWSASADAVFEAHPRRKHTHISEVMPRPSMHKVRF